MGSGVFTGGGGIMICSPLGHRRCPRELRRPDPLDALSVQNGVIFAESVLIHEFGTTGFFIRTVNFKFAIEGL